jgi:hypothetical protein
MYNQFIKLYYVLYAYKTTSLLKVDRVASVLTSRKVSVLVGIAIVFVVIIDLLMTRQILSYNNDSEAIMFF